MLSIESSIINNNSSSIVTPEQFITVSKKKKQEINPPNLKTIAFDIAQDKFINECLDICSKSNEKNKIINININQDKIIINIKNEDFIFSKKVFFNNNYFREKFANIYYEKYNITPEFNSYKDSYMIKLI